MKSLLLVLLVTLVVSCATVKEREPETIPVANLKSSADLKAFEEQGYNHASQRFLQMDALRRSASGRLSELFGPTKWDQDRHSYSLGLPQILPQMEKKLAKLYPEAFEILGAYAAGVNRFRDQVIQSASGTPLRVLLDAYRNDLTHDPAYVPDAWKPIDSLAVGLALSIGLGSSLEETLILGSIYRKLYVEKNRARDFIDFLDPRPIEPFTPLAHEVERSKEPRETDSVAHNTLPYTYECREYDYPFQRCRNRAAGSNMWAIAGKRIDPKMKTAAMLASDPHLPLFFPSFFYETTINSKKNGGTFNMTGESIPGIPGISIGHNDRIAWGITNSMAHVDQVYVETLSDDGKSVKFKNNWVELKTQEIEVTIREPKGVLRKEKLVIRTVPHHGNLFSEHWDEFKEQGKNTALSYRWAGFDDGGAVDFAGTLNLSRATNFDEFKSAVNTIWTSAGNFLYADVDGNIGYVQHGHYPFRGGISNDYPPYIPLPGDGKFEWSGWRNRFPQAYNPANGYLVVVNDDPWGRNLEKHLGELKDYFSFKSTDGCRGKRIRDLIEAKKNRISVQDVQAIQFDHKDLLAQRLINEVLKPLNKKGALKHSPTGKLLLHWNAEMNKSKPEPLFYAAWLSVMMAKHFEATVPLGVFPQLAQMPAGVQTFYHQLIAKLKSDPDGTANWVLDTLSKAEGQLRDTRRWGNTWGSDHKLTFITGAKPLVDCERDGSWLTVDVGAYGEAARKDGALPANFANNYGPNFRLITSLQKSGEIKTLAVLPGGENGEDNKRYCEGHYRD